jgi:hypothetical protein
MDPIEFEYENLAAVPEAFRGLYAEKDGKAVLTHVNGIKTLADVNNVQEALRKERNDHALAQTSLRGWKALGEDPSKIQQILDTIPELKASAGQIDEEKLNKILEGRMSQKIAPLNRQLETITGEMTTVSKERDTLKNSLRSRDLSDAVRSVATEMKVVPTAMSDIEMVAAHYLEKDEISGQFFVKAGVSGATPGMDVKGFLKEMQKVRPHWWPASRGGGAGGGGDLGDGNSNPWTKDNWNITSQSRFYTQNGAVAAQKAAKAAGTTIGGARPVK